MADAEMGLSTFLRSFRVTLEQATAPIQPTIDGEKERSNQNSETIAISI